VRRYISWSSPASRDLLVREGAAVAFSFYYERVWSVLTTVVFELCLLACHDTRNPAEHLRGLQCRRNEALIALDLLHIYPQLECAVDLAVLHEISPGNSRVVAGSGRHVALLNILGQVQLDVPEYYPLASSRTPVLLYDLEFNEALLQHAILVHSEPDGYGYVVVVEDFVVSDRATFCATAVFGSCGVREVPFYKGCAIDEWDVIEID
jgi:hypothetical protein